MNTFEVEFKESGLSKADYAKSIVEYLEPDWSFNYRSILSALFAMSMDDARALYAYQLCTGAFDKKEVHDHPEETAVAMSGLGNMQFKDGKQVGLNDDN